MGNTKNTKGAAAAVEAQVEFQTLASLRKALGPADDDVRAELFDEVTDDDMRTDGTRVVSEELVPGVVKYCSAVLGVLAGLGAAQLDDLVGFDRSFLPVLVDETVRLDALVARSHKEGITVEVTLAERRAHARSTNSSGIARRNQATRAMRRVLRGQASELAALESSVGDASTAKALASGLSFIAEQIDAQLGSAKPARVSLMKRVKLSAAYAQQLRALAASVLSADSAATATVQTGVTQRALDLQDGRVMRVIDWVNRAFRDANAVDGAIHVPKLGALEPLFFNTNRSAKDAPVVTPPVA